VDTSSGAIRLVGLPARSQPIPLLDVGIARSGEPVLRSLDALRGGVTVELALPQPVPAVDATGRPLSLSFTAFAPMDLVVGPVAVGYQ
jgi:hypothetical protein